MDNLWNRLNEDFPFNFEEDKKTKISYNYMELNNLALRVIQEIDYEKRGLELNINFNLIEKSEFWIFTRSFVNKDINESIYFDEKSENIDANDNFNKYSSLIKIIKDPNMDRCYITFGTFYQEINENNKLYYKSFLKRQLIDYSFGNNNNNYYNFNNSEFNVIINDLGEESINAKIYFNNNIESNDITGNFFLPLNKKAKILICGRGKSVRLKQFIVKKYDKRKNGFKSPIKFESENDVPKNCECCTIF